MNEKLTERTFQVRLHRSWTGSNFTAEVKAVSPAQAQRKAEEQNPGWKAQSAS